MKRHRMTGLKLVAGCLALLVWSGCAEAQPTELAPETEIIGFDGGAIIYAKVQHTKLAIVQDFFMQHGREPAVADADEMQVIREQREQAGAVNLLEVQLRTYALERLQITVTPEEYDTGPARLMEGKAFDAEAYAKSTTEQMRKTCVPLYQAVIAVYEQGVSPAEAYNEYLTIVSFPQDSWEAYLIQYRDEGARQDLRDLAEAANQLDEDAIIQSLRATAAEELKTAKLSRQVDELIAANDEEFRAALKDNDPWLPYLGERRKEWWERLRTELKPVALHPRFEQAVEEFLAREPRLSFPARLPGALGTTAR